MPKVQVVNHDFRFSRIVECMRQVVKLHEFNESYEYREGLTKPRLVNHDFRISRVVECDSIGQY
jgi:hypothetical protein